MRTCIKILILEKCNHETKTNPYCERVPGSPKRNDFCNNPKNNLFKLLQQLYFQVKFQDLISDIQIEIIAYLSTIEIDHLKRALKKQTNSDVLKYMKSRIKKLNQNLGVITIFSEDEDGFNNKKKIKKISFLTIFAF